MNKIQSIEGLRGLAALYVLLGHVVTLIDPLRTFPSRKDIPAALTRFTDLMWHGHLAVAAFIVISGFCLQWALFSRSETGEFTGWKKYLVRRCRRILPPYYACLALSLLVCYFVTSRYDRMPFTQYIPVNTSNTLAHVLLVHNWSIDWMYKINGVLWSIAIEFQLYFLFPVLVWLLVKARNIFAVIVVSGGVLIVLNVLPGQAKYYLWFLPLFMLGMACARSAHSGGMKYSGLLGWVAFGASCWYSTNLKSPVTGDLLIGLATALWMMSLVSGTGGIGKKLLGSRLIAGLGAMSYSLYLMHHPILQVVYTLLPREKWSDQQAIVILYAIAVPIILVLVYMFYLVFEKPFIRKKINA